MGGACCGDASATSQPQNKPKDSGDKFEKAVNTIFDKYDVDKSGYLDKNELSKVINAALSDMEGGRAAKQEEIEQLMRKTDASKDGKVTREELLVLFKKLAK